MGKNTHGIQAQLLVLGLVVCTGLGCAGFAAHRTVYRYFEKPAPQDAWSRKIAHWQARERADQSGDVAGAAPVSAGADSAGDTPATDLRQKYDAFRRQQQREIARGVAEWIQQQARVHYVVDGPIDHWATLGETFRTNGDDCDGLELLVFNMLHELGFADAEVYRAIVFRRRDGQHHMVTLWFEDPNDPWVLDPTGAMTSGMPHMSEVPGWVPLKVFTEDEDYTVRADRVATN